MHPISASSKRRKPAEEVVTSRVEERLRERTLTCPEPPPSGADHVPYARTGDLVFVSGQRATVDGERRCKRQRGSRDQPRRGHAPRPRARRQEIR